MRKILAATAFATSLLLPTLATAGVYEDMLGALRAGDTPAAIALLDRGVDVNTVDRSGNSLLMLAVRENNAELLDQLILRRARLNSRNRDGDTALRMAAFNGQEAFVKRLVEAGAAVNMYGWTPLAYAAFNGHAAIADYLIRHGAEIDARSENGSTALMIAARNGHKAVVEVLLQHKADPTLSNENGLTALDWAQKSANTDIATLLRAAGGGSAQKVVIEMTPAAPEAPAASPESGNPAAAGKTSAVAPASAPASAPAKP